MKAKQFRALLQRKGPILLAGAHDAISAKLVERAGFDAVWVSSFGLSAAFKSMPDANVLTMTETLEISKNIHSAVRIPVIADCDNGYGNAINVIRTVTEFANAGIAGISIEDAAFPKRCSLYPGRHDLVSTEEMSGRIRAAKSACPNPDFLLIARTEALISGLGLEEALKRAGAYAQAGADALLIHSKAKSPQEVLAFTKSWKGKTPLVVVPTMFPNASAEELSQAGFKVIIFANHALRAAVAGMRDQLRLLRKEGRAEVIDGAIAPLQEIYELVGVSEFQAQEEAFIPASEEPVAACILAAGFEENLLPLIQDRPKTMLEIKGRSILERQVALLRSVGITNIHVVRGYQGQAVQMPGVQFHENPLYETSGIAASLFSAGSALQGRLLVLYGDILFDRTILERLLESTGEVSLAVDRAWYDLYRSEGRSPEGADLVEGAVKPIQTHRFLPSEESGSVLKIGQRLDKKDCTGEFIGLCLFSTEGTRRLHQIREEGMISPQGQPYHEAPSFSRASLTDLLQEMIDRKVPVKAVEIYKGWLEVDTFEDYRRAWAKL
ncbi:MAG: isocitrate lyase/phosphoenolpyruvate mutase family protein [Candidatus Omnitrophica bacterium]|nr:isocitrate lyase/phosphoenolpyruvate mutase family protein [Candidatus Omnitrophota bacterium]